MVHYRRNRVAGGTYFFTVTLRDRRATWLTDCIDDLRRAYRVAHDRMPFTTDAIVVLPDHIHVLWTLPPDDSYYSGRWRLIKSGFSRALLRAGRIRRENDGPGVSLWQSRFWEHTIRDERDFTRHVDYIHYNPVKHGHAARAIDWPHSSFHQHVKRGDLQPDWGDDGLVAAEAARFGE